MARNCSCGCDTFRFKHTDPNDPMYAIQCRNCGHTLSEHIPVVRSKQAD